MLKCFICVCVGNDAKIADVCSITSLPGALDNVFFRMKHMKFSDFVLTICGFSLFIPINEKIKMQEIIFIRENIRRKEISVEFLLLDSSSFFLFWPLDGLKEGGRKKRR